MKYCTSCGAPLQDGLQFCTACGAPAKQTESAPTGQQQPPAQGQSPYTNTPPINERVYYQDPTPAYAGTTAKKPKKNRTGLILACVGLVVLIVAAVILIPIFFPSQASRYEKAQALMDEGNYEEAKTAFLELENYEDASKKASDCQNNLDYKAASALMDDEKYAEAKIAFEALGSFKDSATLAENCGYIIDYAEAEALVTAENYEAAALLLTPLADANYKDSADLLKKCNNTLSYREAKAAYDEGRFYTAFKLFTALGDFEDAATLATQCVQGKPNSGQIYRNDSYGGTASKFIINGKNMTTDMYFKLYAGDDLVCTIYLHAGASTSVKLPAGTYQIKAAYGKTWYGDAEMFGADGYYEVMKIGDSDTAQFKANYEHTLTMRLESGEGNVTGKTVGMEGF